MTKSDDPFAKTELGMPASAALEPAFAEGQTVFGPFQLHAESASEPVPIAGRSKPSRTVLAAPDPEALATSEAFEKGFTDLGRGGAGPGQTQPAQWAPGNTQLGTLGPGFETQPAVPASPGPAPPDYGQLTMPGGAPPPEALLPPGPPALPVPGQARAHAHAHADHEIARAEALHAQGVQAGKAGQFAHSDALLRESLDLRRRYRPPGDILVAHGCVSLGTLYFHGQRPDLAEPLYREAWALHRQGLGDLHPDTATRAVELARVLVPLGRVAEAVGMLRGAYEVYSRTIGPFHQATLEVAGMLRQLGG